MNAHNAFREDYCPRSYKSLDKLLGQHWDCKQLAGSDKYAYVCRLIVKLLARTQVIEITANTVCSSAFDWRPEYRLDTMIETINAHKTLV